MADRLSIPIRLLTGLTYAVGAIAITALWCVVIVLIGDAIEIHAIMANGG